MFNAVLVCERLSSFVIWACTILLHCPLLCHVVPLANLDLVSLELPR